MAGRKCSLTRTSPSPNPKPDQAVVKIDVAGINFIDIYFRTGLYKTDLPFIGRTGGRWRQ